MLAACEVCPLAADRASRPRMGLDASLRRAALPGGFPGAKVKSHCDSTFGYLPCLDPSPNSSSPSGSRAPRPGPDEACASVVARLVEVEPGGLAAVRETPGANRPMIGESADTVPEVG